MEKKKVVAVLQAVGCIHDNKFDSNTEYRLDPSKEYCPFSVAYVLYSDGVIDILPDTAPDKIKYTHKVGGTSHYVYERNITIIYPYDQKQARILLEAIRDGVLSNLK